MCFKKEMSGLSRNLTSERQPAWEDEDDAKIRCGQHEYEIQRCFSDLED